MNVPIPVLIAVGVALLVPLWVVLRRRGAGRDLIAPPRYGTPPPPRQSPPPAWPAGAAAIGDLPPELEAEVRALLDQNRKIDAIKIVRQATRLGLREAKEMVERME